MSRLYALTLFFVVGLIVLYAWPQMDIWISSFFFSAQQGRFLFTNDPFLNGMTKTIFYGARLMGVVFLLAAVMAFLRKKNVARLDGKSWIFLFLCLLIGPGLLANVVFKDHWGRARPRDTDVFGGSKPFTPAFVMSDVCERNCSFVSGDASFGFFLPAIAYLVSPSRRRRVFWGMVGLGSVIAAARIVLGAHFLSDVLAAILLVMGSSAVLHALLYGRMETKRCWRDFIER